MIRRLLRRLWPDTLAGQVVLVLLAGLTVFHLGSIWLHQLGTEAMLGTTREGQLGERLAAAKRAIAARPPAERDQTAHALSTPSLDLHWSGISTIRLSEETSPRIAALRARLVELVPELGEGQIRLGYADEGYGAAPRGENFRHLLVGALQLPDGSWLNLSAALFRPPAPPGHATLLSTTAMAAGILLVGLFVVRSLNRPLRHLAEAADRIGAPGAPSVAMPEEGPREVRHAAQAFNRMQGRIDRLIADRTQALAAVSHDLRTPIARLRLRAGFVEDAETQRAIDADLDEMEAMIEATLAYLRGEAEREDPRPADLAAMLVTLCDAAADAGHAVTYAGPGQARLRCRPVALKRAFANLIDNAVKYGGGARVVLEDTPDAVTLRVEDDGPGIPAAAMEAVFEPFRRLEGSRNRSTGGSGLGLTIARQVAEAHGGTLRLENRAGGGLTARLRLPRPKERAPSPEEGGSMADSYGRRGTLALVLAAMLPGTVRAEALARLTVWRDPSCGCCGAWIEHMRTAGFTVEDKVVTAPVLAQVRRMLGTPSGLLSCHAARVGGFTLEGHVPAMAVRRLLAGRRAGIRGLAVPAMPIGSPGMEVPGKVPDTYDVIAFDAAGGHHPYMRFHGGNPA